MVGVPGKSKGCSTCRRRKKGCDQARPHCGQCKQSGYTCGGYKRDLTFIHHPASKAVQSATFAPVFTKEQTLKIVPYCAWDSNALDLQCRSLFWDLYMPRGDCTIRDPFIIKCGHPMDWTMMVQELPGEESSLDRAFSALSISRVGRDNEDDRLVRESTKLYGQALKDLQTALYDPDRMYSDEVLTACMLLSLYEVFEGSARRDFGWISHTQGAARLVQLRGAHRHANRQAHYVFLGARLPTLYAAILQRRTTFLASEDWLTLPWQSQPRTFHDQLIDIMTRIPTLLEHVDIATAIRDPMEAHEKQLGMLAACRQVNQALHDWRRLMKAGAGELISNHDSQPDDNYPFDFDITYANHLFANTQVIYWTCCLVISDTMHDLHLLLDRAASVKDGQRDIITAAEHALSKQYALGIAQSINYFLLPEMGALGANLISFPMGLAYRFFRKSHETEICAWFVRSLNNMKKRGFHIGRFLGAFTDEEDGGRAVAATEANVPKHVSTCRWAGCNVGKIFTHQGDSSSGSEGRHSSPLSTGSYGSTNTTFIHEDPFPQVT